MNNGNNPANPLTGDAYIDFSMYDETKDGASSYNPECQGLTKRETFAMAAMKGILSHSFGRGNPEECAIAALQNADALLKELAK